MNDLTNEIKDSNTIASLEIEIDWEQYFRDFCKAHGQYPINYNDTTILFPDGWQYSSSEYSGPEFAPPTDLVERYELKLYYWKRRLIIVRTDLDTLKFNLLQLSYVKDSKSLDLYQKVSYTNEEGKAIVTTQKLDLGLMNKRVEWLENDLKECQKKIKIIEDELTKLRMK